MSVWQGRAVLVTGGAGFIGSHLVERLVAEGARTTVIDKRPIGDWGNLAAIADRIQVRELDVGVDDLHPVLSREPWEAVFHLAGDADITGSVQRPRQDFAHNLRPTFNLLEGIRECGARPRFVFTSSAAVYGEGSDRPISEEAPTAPIAPYGVSKLTGEAHVRLYARLYALPAAIVRLFPVYGPRLRRQVVYDMIRKVRADPQELFVHGDGSQVRDLNHVSNVVEALLLVATRGALGGESYNVAADEAVSIRELVAMICRLMAASPRVVYSTAVRPGDARSWIADISRLKTLGYRLQRPLAEGLADTVTWVLGESTGAAAPDPPRATWTTRGGPLPVVQRPA